MLSMVKRVLCITLLFFTIAKVHARQVDQNLTLVKIEGIALGSSKQVLAHTFGKPREAVSPSLNQNTIEWYYGEGHYNRAAFLMDGISGRIVSKIWNVMEGDAELSLDTVMARYPGAHFLKSDSKFIHPHKGYPTEAWYEDQSQGLSIQVKKATNEVESIVWCAKGINQTDSTCFKNRMDKDLR